MPGHLEEFVIDNRTFLFHFPLQTPVNIQKPCHRVSSIQHDMYMTTPGKISQVLSLPALFGLHLVVRM